MVDRASNEDRLVTSRRDLLGFGGAVGLAFLSGCTRDVVEEFPKNTKWPISELSPELPVHERSNLLVERIEEVASADIETVDGFAETLREHGVEILAIDEVREVLSLEFATTVRRGTGVLHDVATAAGAYAALVESGYEMYALAITIHPSEGSSYGSATVETKLAKRYNAGELTAAEYGELVSSTVESKRTPPEVGVTPDE